MNHKYHYLKISIWILDAVCISICILLSFQIMQQKEESEALTEFEEYRREILQNENSLLNDVREQIDRYAEVQNEISKTEGCIEDLTKKYNIKSYIDAVAAEMNEDDENSNYIEKYFNVSREELYEILAETDIADKWESPFGDMETSELLLPVGDKVWLRYSNNSDFPIGVVVENSKLNIGYEGARAGMRRIDIKKIVPESEEKEIDYAGEKFFYLLFEDNAFSYYFVSGGWDDPATLYITHK